MHQHQNVEITADQGDVSHAWQREQMADLWLGFERADIRRWLAEAGLIEIDVDCAEGTCCAKGPGGEVKPLSIFVAIGKKA